MDTENQIAIIPAPALCLPSVRPAAPEWFPELFAASIRHHNIRYAYACQVVQFHDCYKGRWPGLLVHNFEVYEGELGVVLETVEHVLSQPDPNCYTLDWSAP